MFFSVQHQVIASFYHLTESCSINSLPLFFHTTFIMTKKLHKLVADKDIHWLCIILRTTLVLTSLQKLSNMHTTYKRKKKKNNSYSLKNTELLMKIELYEAWGVCISYMLVRLSQGIQFDASKSEDCSSLIYKRRQKENFMNLRNCSKSNFSYFNRKYAIWQNILAEPGNICILKVKIAAWTNKIP